jgi:tetratricopeptide (TPR) repeat protein
VFVPSQRVAARLRRIGHDHDVDYASELDGAADQLLELARPAEALALAVESIAITEPLGAAGRSELATGLWSQGRALLALGRAREARAPLERAVAIAESEPDKPVSSRGTARYALARDLSALGELDRARALGALAEGDVAAGVKSFEGQAGVAAIIHDRLATRLAEITAWRATIATR